jgi:K+/H+ antiporter YhaU regulatory subunit KhtT
VEQLNKIQLTFYQEEIENLYQLFSQRRETEISIPSMLNMTRKINNSNEAMLRAVSNLIAKEVHHE